MPAEPPCNTGHKSQCPCWAENAGAKVGSSPLKCKLSLVTWKWCGCSLLSSLSPPAVKRAKCSLPPAGVVELTGQFWGAAHSFPEKQRGIPAAQIDYIISRFPLSSLQPLCSSALTFLGFFRKISWSSPQLSLLNGCFPTWRVIFVPVPPSVL